MHPRQLFHSSTGQHADCTAGSKGRGAQREALRGGPGERGRGDKRRWEEEGSGRLCVARARVITPLGPSSSSCRPFSQHPTRRRHRPKLPTRRHPTRRRPRPTPAQRTNLGRPSSALAEQKLVHEALPTRSVPARCCLSTGTEERSSRAPRRAARAAHSAMRTQERVRAEARTMELRAVAQLGRAAGRSPAPPLPPRSAAPAAAAAPCAPPYGRS